MEYTVEQFSNHVQIHTPCMQCITTFVVCNDYYLSVVQFWYCSKDLISRSLLWNANLLKVILSKGQERFHVHLWSNRRRAITDTGL